MNPDFALCPVCGEPSFPKSDFPGSYTVCANCGWEDDLFQYADPNFEGGVNKLSLNKARNLFAEKKRVVGKNFANV